MNRAGRRLQAPSGSPFAAPDLDDARDIVEHWRGLHAIPLSKVATALRHQASEAGGNEFAVTQRLKRLDTIVEKLGRHPGTLTQMEDIGGVRVVVGEQATVDGVTGSLERRWNIRRVRQYIDGRQPGPKPDGYRAVHLIAVVDDRFIEIQLRTRRQDRWAQAVERDTRRLGEPLKFGGGSGDLREYYRLVAEQLAATADGRSLPIELQQELSQLYHATARYYDLEGDDI